MSKKGEGVLYGIEYKFLRKEIRAEAVKRAVEQLVGKNKPLAGDDERKNGTRTTRSLKD